MKTLYTAFKGKNNTSYQFVSRIDNNSLFLTNSFTGLEKDITRFDCDFDAVYMFGIDKNLVDKIRIDLCACYNSEHIFIDNDNIINKKCPNYLDKQWYIDEAIKRLKSFGIKYEG